MDIEKIEKDMEELSNKEEDVETYNIQDLFNKPLPKIEYLDDERFLPQKSILMIGGAQSAGKSLVAMQLSMAIATGNLFLDKFKMQKMPVLYINEEMNLPRIITRFNELRVGHQWLNEDFSNLHLSQYNNLKLDNRNKQKWFLSLLDKYNPGLVVLDSVVRMMEGDENNSKDVRKIFDFLKPILKKRNTSFLILHHQIKTYKKKSHIYDLRGSGDFSAMPDVVIMFNKYGHYVNCYVSKHRDRDNFNFSIFFENTIEKNLKLRYLEEDPAEKDSIEGCSELIKEWLEEEKLLNFRTKQVVECIKETDYCKDTMYKAIKSLEKEKLIQKTKRGHWKVKKSNDKDEDCIKL